MLFDGTSDFPSFKKLNQFFDKTAGVFHASTSDEVISIYGTFVDEELENSIYALEQIIFKPILSRKSFKKQKSIIKDELKINEDQNDYKLYLKARETRFIKNKILQSSVGGTSKTVDKIKYSQVLSFYKKFFIPNNINIIIAGKFEINKLIKYLEKRFSKYKERELELLKYDSQIFSSKRIKIIKESSAIKSYVFITFPSYTMKDDIIKRISLGYLISMLTERRDSILSSKLRE